MGKHIELSSIAINIEDPQECILQGPSTEQLPKSNRKKPQNNAFEFNVENEFENNCQFNLNKQYNWKSNGWGKSPICIPAPIEINDKWENRTLDPGTSDYDEKSIKSVQHVHQAFQSSSIGGILIQDIDYANIWDVLKSSDISSEIKQLLKPREKENERKKVRKAGIDKFKIGFLFFHPIAGIYLMECRTYEDSESSLQTECKDAMWETKQASRNLLDVFKTLTGTQFSSQTVHFVLCVPNLKKEKIDGIDQTDILDEQDFKDNSRLEEFWKAQTAKHQGVGVNYFEDTHVFRILALTFGFRSAKFTSLASSSLEIFRKIDSQEGSGYKIGQFDSGNKIFFLNSEQLTAYNIAKSGQNMLLFGPQGSGKTLLIQLLAKEASEKEGKGRVVLILPYEELANIYINFFKATRKNQKREIIINPSNAELQSSLASDSFDDIFADEVLYGDWIPKENRSKRQITVGITTGRRYEKSRVSIAKAKLEKELKNANFCLYKLNFVMRNTGNIWKYYSQLEKESKRTPPPHGIDAKEKEEEYEKKSNNEIVMGHNIEGPGVIEITTSDTKSAVTAIVNRIKQYLGKDNGGNNDCTNYCSPTDIAVLVAHQPVSSHINQIKKALNEAGIETGSITEQIAAKATTNRKPIVAVDSSANVLSLEWPIAFVVNATKCPYSKNLSNPIVSYSRAVSLLIVVKTGGCNYKYFKYFCSSDFHHFFSFFEKQNLYSYNDIIGEINLRHSIKIIMQFVFWLVWGTAFIGGPTMLLSYLIFFWRSIDYFRVTNVVYSAAIGILVLLIIALGLVSFKNYRKTSAIIADLIMIYSFFILIVYSVFISDRGIIEFLELGPVFLIFYILGCILKILLIRQDHTSQYFPDSQNANVCEYILKFGLIGLILNVVLSGAVFLTVGYDFSFFLLVVLLYVPFLSNILKLPFRSQRLKSILIQPMKPF